MNIAALKQSRYLTKEDFGAGKLVTIKGDLVAENVAKQDEPEEIKHLIFFAEFEKGMVLNSVNAQLIAKIVGSEETSDWDGKQIVAYNDPSVVMRGKLTGGIRVRAPRTRPAQPAPTQAAPRNPVLTPSVTCFPVPFEATQPAPRNPIRAPAPHNTAQRAPAPAAPEDNGDAASDEVPF